MLSLLSSVSALALMKALVFAPIMTTTTQYQISRSLRFKISTSAGLNRTWGAPTTQNIWTFSCWVKRGRLATFTTLLGASTGASPAYDALRFTDTDTIQFFQAGAASISVATSIVYRDPAAWYHVVLAYDATQVTAGNRVVLYVNGVQHALSGTFPVQNPSSTTYNINRSGAVHGIGTNVINAVNGLPLDGLMAEVYFVDGQALPPSYFGEIDIATGVWIPKRVIGNVTMGAQGVYLDFSDPTSTTTLCADRSGNGNNWTATGITAGTGSGSTPDSFVDSPTLFGIDTGVGGEVRGNYCTFNHLQTFGGAQTSDNANLWFNSSASVVSGLIGTMRVSSGKWYFEVYPNSVAGAMEIGIVRGDQVTAFSTNGFGQDALGYVYANTGNKGNNNSFVAYGATFTAGDTIGCAFDLDAGTLTFYKNGTSQGVAYSSLPAGDYNICMSDAGTTTVSTGAINFGQTAFVQTAPSGYKALCTQNLVDPAILKSNSYFDIGLYTGVAANVSVTGKLSPDLVWLKRRDSTGNHGWEDTSRGASQRVIPNLTAAEDAGGFTSFNSDGFTVANGNPEYNIVAATYVSWLWKKGAVPGFDIVTYTGNGANRTIAHALGAVPAMIFCKSRGSAQGWQIYHKNHNAGAPQNAYLMFNQNASAVSSSAWNNTAPTSSVFSLGVSGLVNIASDNSIAYLFAEVPGFSRFNIYIGNAVVDGPYVWCGFRPRFIMIKRWDAGTSDWVIMDAVRDSANVSQQYLFPNTNAAEGSSAILDILSNGFKIRNSGTNTNPSGGGLIFAAFAENPFKLARAR